MNKEDFTQELMIQLAEAFPPSFENTVLERHEVNGFNGKHYNALSIHSDNSIISPAINLDQYYEHFSNGREMSDIVEEIVFIKMKENSVLDKIDIDALSSFEACKPDITARICDIERNQDNLEFQAHKDFGDFAAVYRVVVNKTAEEEMSTSITPELLNRWGVSIDEVHRAAMENMKPTLMNINDLLYSMMGIGETQNLLDMSPEQADEMEMNAVPMFVLRTEAQQFGAAALLNPETTKKACEVLGSDCFVLPSSVHEVLLLPVMADVDLKDLLSLVNEVNVSEVADNEILSDKVQYCDKETGLFMNAEQYMKEKEFGKDNQREIDVKGPSL